MHLFLVILSIYTGLCQVCKKYSVLYFNTSSFAHLTKSIILKAAKIGSRKLKCDIFLRISLICNMILYLVLLAIVLILKNLLRVREQVCAVVKKQRIEIYVCLAYAKLNHIRLW